MKFEDFDARVRKLIDEYAGDIDTRGRFCLSDFDLQTMMPQLFHWINATIEQEAKERHRGNFRYVGSAANMPGANAFTMGAFSSDEVPYGSHLFILQQEGHVPEGTDDA